MDMGRNYGVGSFFKEILLERQVYFIQVSCEEDLDWYDFLYGKYQDVDVCKFKGSKSLCLEKGILKKVMLVNLGVRKIGDKNVGNVVVVQR